MTRAKYSDYLHNEFQLIETNEKFLIFISALSIYNTETKINKNQSINKISCPKANQAMGVWKRVFDLIGV